LQLPLGFMAGGGMRFRGQDHQRQRLRQPFPDHAGLLHQAVGQYTLFDWLRDNLPPFRGSEKIADAPGQAQKTIRVDLSAVTGMHEAVLINYPRGTLGVSIITEHGGTAAYQYFLIVTQT